MTEPVRLTYPGATVDTLLETVNGSNLSATHKITRSATLVVAASDSSEKSKAQADYVCNGTNDEVEIQAAITALPALGGKVYFCEGNYLKGTASGITIPSNVELELNNAAIIKLADGINADTCIFTNTDQANGNSNISITGGTLDGNEANQTAGIQCGVIFRKVSDLKIDMKIKSFRTLDMQIAGSCSKVERNNRLRRQGDEIELVTIDDMSDPTTWENTANMTVTQDTTYRAVGAASLDVYNTTKLSSSGIKITPTTPYNLTNKVLRLWVRIPEESRVENLALRIYAYSDNGFAMYRYDRMAFADSANGFIYMDLPVGNWEEQTFPDADWGNVTYIQLRHYNCDPVHIWYGGLQMYTAPQQGVVSVSFDDGNISQFTEALPVFNKYRFPAVCAIIPARCYDGADGVSITWEQARMMQSCGWDVIHHTYEHTNLSTLTLDQIRSDLNKSTAAMLQNGIYNSGEFVFPWGDATQTFAFYSTLRKYFHAMRRTSGRLNAIPPNPNYGRYISTCADLRTGTIPLAKTRALQAAKHGAWIDEYAHHILASGGDLTPAELDDYLAYLYDFGIPVKTWTQITRAPQNTSLYPAGGIAPGEIRTITGALTAGLADSITLAWHNPEPCDILIKKVVFDISAAGGTALSVINVGIADDATGTNIGTEFFNGLNANAIAINDSTIVADGGTQTKWVKCLNSSSATGGWIVAKILTQAASDLVGTYYIEYIGT